MSSSKSKPRGPIPTIRPDLSSDLSPNNRLITTYQGNNQVALTYHEDNSLNPTSQSPKPSHKDKYALSLLPQSHNPKPSGQIVASSPRPTIAGPIQISNSFSPLRSESPSFKTITSSHISPHSSKQDKLTQVNQSQITSSSFPRINSPVYHYQVKPFFDRYFTVKTPILLDHYFKEPKKLADAVIDPQFCRIPEDITKRHIFYEFILVDTDSIYVLNVFDKIDKEKLIFRKLNFTKSSP